MARLKVRTLKGGRLEIPALEAFIEAKVGAVLEALGLRGSRATPKRKPADPLIEAMERHPKKAELLRAGANKDQLLRSLIPLYVGRSLEGELTSGAISRFWKHYGVRYAGPNAAKALRQNVGYAKAGKQGRRITPNGVKYVEAALSQKKSAA
jgi:hypothetical protein